MKPAPFAVSVHAYLCMENVHFLVDKGNGIKYNLLIYVRAKQLKNCDAKL